MHSRPTTPRAPWGLTLTTLAVILFLHFPFAVIRKAHVFKAEG